MEPDTSSALRRRVIRWAGIMRVKPTQIRLQAMKRKWASCSTRGWVSFSLELANQRKAFQDFVIVHELLHLVVPNHGKLFKSLMKAYLPEWEKAAQQLDGQRN